LRRLLDETDNEVIEACRRGESDAFRAIFDRYKDKVYSIRSAQRERNYPENALPTWKRWKAAWRPQVPSGSGGLPIGLVIRLRMLTKRS
jgi:hypothetical protein